MDGRGLDGETARGVAWPEPGVAAARDAFVRLPVERRRAARLVIIDHRTLMADCLLRGFLDLGFAGLVATFQTVADWLAELPGSGEGALVLLSLGDRSVADLKRDWMEILAARGGSALVVLLAEKDKANVIVEAMGDGVRGFIPTSLPLGIAAQALDLVLAGGTFVPAAALRGLKGGQEPQGAGSARFTGRQAEVVKALLKGTSNKVIAYELNMAESTVKVHVRNVMRKLKARNRTHVAFLLHERDSGLN